METRRHNDRIRRWLRAIILVLGSFFALLSVSVVFVEARHHKRFGHFVGYGVHLDIVRESSMLEESIAKGDGRIFDYSVVVSNYTFRPLTLWGTVVESDFMAIQEVRFRYQVQRWNDKAKQWENIVDRDPAKKSETWPGQVRLWSGRSATVVPGELTALRKGLDTGDSFRFVVFSNTGGATEGNSVVLYSPVVLIDYKPHRSPVPLRVAH